MLQLLLQIWRMLCDIIVLLIAVYAIIKDGEVFVPLFMLFLWFKDEPLESWRPSVIKQFFKNTKQLN
jgi:hypothetical protein